MSTGFAQPDLPRKTISEKKLLVEQWIESKTTIAEFCTIHQISVSVLKYWRRQFGAPPKRKRRKKAFVEVSIPVVEQAGGMIDRDPLAEVILQNGNRSCFTGT